MIECWMMPCVIVGILALVIGLAENRPWLLVVSGLAAIVALFSVITFVNSDYKSFKETEYPVHIGSNHAAFIYVDQKALNVNCITNENFKDGDIVTIKEYNPYWAGHVYIEGKTEYIAKHKD